MSLKNKDRLYVCLVLRGGMANMPGYEDTYHWSLVRGPKREKRNAEYVQYHARNDAGPEGAVWRYERSETPSLLEKAVLTRVLVAKVVDAERLETILPQVPLPGEEGNCVRWVQMALKALEEDKEALGRRELQWKKVRDKAMGYTAYKRTSHRYDGKGLYDPDTVATFDLLRNTETIR